MQITVTDAAASYLQSMLAKKPGTYFRLSVKKTGCSGYSYAPSQIAEQPQTDCEINVKEGLTIYLDPAWLSLLENLQIDYTEEQQSGLKQKRLVFTNPQESSRCGCGESFHIAEGEV
jgi:iron-sulfur cluster assembly protein